MSKPQTINIFLANHPYVAQETLRDLCVAFAGMLRSLGHHVVMGPVLQPPPALNLMFEHFDDTTTGLLEPVMSGFRMAMICTEPFGGNPFSPPEYRQMRIRNMMKIGAKCRFIWCLDPVTLDDHRKAFPHLPVHLTPIGYVDDMSESKPAPKEEVIWDICFTGTMTEYRQAVLAQLTAAGMKVAAGLFPHFVRQSIMERSRLNVTLRQTADRFLPSQGRLPYCLANNFYLVSDLGDRAPETQIERYVVAIPPTEFVGWCREFTAGRIDKAPLDAKIAAFKTEYRMDALNAEAVAASLAAL